jgi:hypothetical protein
MADKEFLGDRRRKEEEEYFRRQEEQLIEKLRQRRAADAARRDMTERTGVVDQEILGDLETLGYTPETVGLLFLLPLVEVAWADGTISHNERVLVVEAARARGIEAGSAADQQLAGWLDAPPSADFYQNTRRAIGAILHGRSAEQREADQRDLLSYSLAVAAASGGILGLGKVSNDEKQVLTRLTRELERIHGPVAPPISTGDKGRP